MLPYDHFIRNHHKHTMSSVISAFSSLCTFYRLVEMVRNSKLFHHNSWWSITFCIVILHFVTKTASFSIFWHRMTHTHTQTLWHNVTLTAGLYLIEGDNVTITLDAEGSIEVSVLETNDSQGCKDFINEYLDEGKDAARDINNPCMLLGKRRSVFSNYAPIRPLHNK